MLTHSCNPSHRIVNLLAPQSAYNTCPKGQQALFSAYMIYQVHLFIFLLAVIHVIYVAGTLLVCLAQVRGWAGQETACGKGMVGWGKAPVESARMGGLGDGKRCGMRGYIMKW